MRSANSSRAIGPRARPRLAVRLGEPREDRRLGTSERAAAGEVAGRVGRHPSPTGRARLCRRDPALARNGPGAGRGVRPGRRPRAPATTVMTPAQPSHPGTRGPRLARGGDGPDEARALLRRGRSRRRRRARSLTALVIGAGRRGPRDRIARRARGRAARARGRPRRQGLRRVPVARGVPLPRGARVDLPAPARCRSTRSGLPGDRVATATLPFAAHSLSRRVLDEALRGARRPARWSARREAGGAPRGLAARARGTAARATAFLATGKHDLRGFSASGRQADLSRSRCTGGWRRRRRSAGAPRRAGPVRGRLRRPAAGRRWPREPVPGGSPPPRPARAALGAAARGDPRASPHLDARLAGAEPCWARPLALAAIPYGRPARADGPWRLGDQAAVIPSFSGDGMSIALHTPRSPPARTSTTARPTTTSVSSRATWLARSCCRPRCRKAWCARRRKSRSARWRGCGRG